MRARVARESSTNLEAHTHTRERERERERRGNMVKVAKTARTFDAVREFVVGFLSFYFLSLSLDVSRLDGLGLACRSAERSPSLSLSLSLSLFLVSFRMRKLYSLRECRR